MCVRGELRAWEHVRFGGGGEKVLSSKMKYEVVGKQRRGVGPGEGWVGAGAVFEQLRLVVASGTVRSCNSEVWISCGLRQ